MRKNTATTPIGIAATMLLLAFAAPAQAQDMPDGPKKMVLGADMFVSGLSVLVGQDTDDLFAAGQRVDNNGDVGGDALLAGRFVYNRGAVGGDVYAAGQTVDLLGPVAGDATLAGSSIYIGAPVNGDVRLAASQVTINGDITGTALIAAESVYLSATVGGDIRITAANVEFGPGAQVNGRLTLYTKNNITVPDRVAPAERITRSGIDFAQPHRDGRDSGFAWAAVCLGVLLVALAILLGVALLWTARRCENIRTRPFAVLLAGFLGLAALIGAIPLLAATVIGALLIPVVIVAIPLAVLLGYLLGAQAFGELLWRLMRRAPAQGFLRRFVIGVIGLFVAAIICLIPFLGWLFALALTLVGIGAIVFALPRRHISA